MEVLLQILVLILTIFLLLVTSCKKGLYLRIFAVGGAFLIFLSSLYVIDSMVGMGFFYQRTFIFNLGAFLIKIGSVLKVKKTHYFLFLLYSGFTLFMLLVLRKQNHFKTWAIGLMVSELGLLLLIVNVPFLFA